MTTKFTNSDFDIIIALEEAIMKINPFNVGFGEEPHAIINRTTEFENIVKTFLSVNPTVKSFIITGPRGCGKTVLLTQIINRFRKESNWLTIDLNQYGNILEQLASSIYDKGHVKHLFIKKEFNISFHGVSFSLKGNNPVANIDTLLDFLLKYLKKKKIHVLITIDDVSNNNNMRLFSHSFQRFIREKYNVALLMTGLYENVSNLSNVNNLTFLLRTPKIRLENLSLRAIALTYKRIFKIDEETSIKLAKLTNGYAYAYQLLGTLYYQSDKKEISKKMIEQYDLTLEDNVYTKTWITLSPIEKKLCYAISKSTKIQNILKQTKLNNSALQVYKKRMSDAGIVDIQTRGEIIFSLPRFKEFVDFQEKL